MGRMKELYENIWELHVEAGMSPQEISDHLKCPVDWVESAIDLAIEDETHDRISSKTIH
jgi:DNA-directed RNA polymerase specialized sigma24 family protein